MPEYVSPEERVQAIAEEIDAFDIVTEDDVEAFRIRFLGRKQGVVTDLFGLIKDLPPEERRDFGQQLNALKQKAEARLEEAHSSRKSSGTVGEIDLDLTLPGRIPPPLEPGSLHPLTNALRRIEEIFRDAGFDVVTGPEIEDDWHNFTALNFPPDHPARDMQDTFFLEPPAPEGRGVVLRTHTSPVQVRAMEEQEPPFRLIAPGRVYRNEAISYKSYCLFHQVEGLVVDEGVTLADLKAMLYTFIEAFFERKPRMRFRPSFFPFTEPSADVHIWWEDENLSGGGRWLEILGCGMVDPAVLENCGIDSETYTGYAFGMGVERLAMLRSGVEDIRLFYENDVRFLDQF